MSEPATPPSTPSPAAPRPAIETPSIPATLPPGRSAAAAAQNLVTRQNAAEQIEGRLGRLRRSALWSGTIAFIGFALCVATGYALMVWHLDGLVTDDSDWLARTVESYFLIVIISHTTSAALCALGVFAYMWFHAAYRRMCEGVSTLVNVRRLPSRIWPMAALCSLLLLGVGSAISGGRLLPDKPQNKELYEVIRERYSALPNDIRPNEQPQIVPWWVRGNETAWAVHTQYLPMVIGLLLAALLFAIYSIQRAEVKPHEAAASAAESAWKPPR